MWKFVEYFISLIFSPILFTIIIITYIYRCCIEWILSKKKGHKFGGILKGKDARMARDTNNENIFNSLQLIDFKTNNSQEVKKIIEQNLKPVFESGLFPKISCTVHRQYGYYYLMKNNYNWDQAVSIFSIGEQSSTMKLSDVQRFLSQIINQKMSQKANALIEFLISDKPLDKTQTFAVIVRIHHALGDGPAAMHFHSYLYKIDLNKIKSAFFDDSKRKQKSTTQNIYETLATIFYITFGSYSVLKMSLFRSKEVNPFYTENSCGRKLVQWISDDNGRVVKKIKEIRKKTGSSFTEILWTCIVASLCQYANRKHHSIDSLTIFETILTKKPDPSLLPQLENNFAVNAMRFQVDSELKKLLANIKRASQSSKNSIFIPTSDAFMRVLGTVLPTFFDHLFTVKNVTMGLTNMSALNKTTVFGYDLKFINFFIPNFDFLNFTMGVICYDNSLNLTVSVDQVCVDNDEELKEILQVVFDKISEFYKQIS